MQLLIKINHTEEPFHFFLQRNTFSFCSPYWKDKARLYLLYIIICIIKTLIFELSLHAKLYDFLKESFWRLTSCLSPSRTTHTLTSPILFVETCPIPQISLSPEPVYTFKSGTSLSSLCIFLLSTDLGVCWTQ